MSSAADLRPVARRTLPVVTESGLLAAARASGWPTPYDRAPAGARPAEPCATESRPVLVELRSRDGCGPRRLARHHGPTVPEPAPTDPDRAPWPTDADAPAAGEPALRGGTPAPAPRGDVPAPMTFDVAPAARTARATTSRAPVARGGATLDEVLSGAWEALSAFEPAPCPICGGAMRPRFGSGAKVESARCGDCSTVLR